MALLSTIALVLQVLSALGVIVLVLLQHGKGADMGAAFGSGSSGSLFGATGSANFLSRLTAALATVFFVCTLALAFLANSRTREPGSVMDRVSTPAPGAPGAPAAPAAGSAPAVGSVPVPGSAPAAGTAAVPGTAAAPAGGPATAAGAAGGVAPGPAPTGDVVKPPVDATQKSGQAADIPK